MVIALAIKYLDFTTSYTQTQQTTGIGPFTFLGIKIGSLTTSTRAGTKFVRRFDIL